MNGYLALDALIEWLKEVQDLTRQVRALCPKTDHIVRTVERVERGPWVAVEEEMD